jgi:pyruvate dehydrogenase E1 component alpha subunit
MYDPDLYRDKAEIARWREHDPIDILAGRMRDAGELDDAVMEELDAELKAEIDAAVAFGEAGTLEPVEQVGRHVYAEEGVA